MCIRDSTNKCHVRVELERNVLVVHVEANPHVARVDVCGTHHVLQPTDEALEVLVSALGVEVDGEHQVRLAASCL